MINNLIKENCQTIRKYRSDLKNENLLNIFDIFLNELNETTEFADKCLLVEEILRSLSHLENRYEKLSEYEIISHDFFVFLRNHLINCFENYQLESIFNLSKLFKNLCFHLNEKTIERMKHFLINKQLIDEIITNIDSKEILIIRSINFLLLSFKDLRRYEITDDEYILLNPILNKIIEYLSSINIKELLINFENNFHKHLNDFEMLIFDTMPFYLHWYPSSYRQIDDYKRLLRNILIEYTKWFINVHPTSFLRCSFKFGQMIRHLNSFLVRPVESNNLNQFSEEFFYEYSKLVFQWSFIFSSLIKTNCQEKFRLKIVVQNLYNLTLHLNLLNLIKTIPNLISMLFKLIEIDDDEIQLNSYRCLGKILNENDIKTLEHSSQHIVSVHCDYLRKTIRDKKNYERFFSLLESLKNFVQHDQVKIELIKENIFSLLFPCLFEENMYSIEVKLIILEIIFSLSFQIDAYRILKTSEEFLNYIRTNQTNQQLDNVCQCILWKLEREEDLIKQSNEIKSYLYDIMISYSHVNKQICLQIYQQLINDGYRIWIDQDCLYGQTMNGMASAIENCQFVLILMSNTYKESVYCQSEAHYAFERGCSIIPILIESNYKPDGWLGIIVSGKIFVNFADQDFDLAYQLLKNQIDQQKFVLSKCSSSQISRIHATKDRQSSDDRFISNEISQLPDDIHQWTNDHVKLFFQICKLDKSLFYLCSNMNGSSLFELYQICCLDRQSMYQSLKYELNFKYQIFLSISDYILFIQQIQSYLPKNYSSSFSFPFCNIL